MKTVTEEVNDSFNERGSKFTGYLFPADSTRAFERRLEELRKDYHDATHHCYAWRIDPSEPREFSQDDGEPSGTAGLPILNQLKSFNAINSAIVVIRYYGGTNLGRSGLIEAYGRSARHCLEKATLRTIVGVRKIRLSYPYSRQNQIDRLKNDFELQELSAEYTDTVTLMLAVPHSVSGEVCQRLEEWEHLGIRFEETGDGYLTG